MIQITILISAGIAYFFAVFLKNKRVGYSLMSVFIALFLISIGLLVGNEYGHFGMEKVTTNKNIAIQTVKKGSNLLLYKKLGTGSEKVYVYRTPDTAKAKKPNTTKADINVSNKVKQGNFDNAKIRQKTTRWEYKNGFYSFLFNLSGNGHEFVKQSNTFEIGSDWMVLSTTQANKLDKLLKDKDVQAQMKSEGTEYVESAVAKKMAEDPSMSETERADVVKQAQAEYQASAVKKLVGNLK
ncbi:DUF4811 domain-containing protein [Companilactobacillus furfuricola]|uniref:DUF4811 domain-containing protein n=1 Tax=Companilactobacillus furfuricola TaxID=1462575 RepID=UPI000F77A608|nr:DUF4811 domain-containing protein [Companilactobacillus furfuricola]